MKKLLLSFVFFISAAILASSTGKGGQISQISKKPHHAAPAVNAAYVVKGNWNSKHNCEEWRSKRAADCDERATAFLKTKEGQEQLGYVIEYNALPKEKQVIASLYQTNGGDSNCDGDDTPLCYKNSLAFLETPKGKALVERYANLTREQLGKFNNCWNSWSPDQPYLHCLGAVKSKELKGEELIKAVFDSVAPVATTKPRAKDVVPVKKKK